MVSLMTALWFAHLRGARPRLGQAARLAGAARDQRPARPAGPGLPRALREFGGLQSYPSRTKDPTRSTTRPARSASGRRRRSGARSPTATWPGTSRSRSAGGRSRCSATPSSTRARAGRRSRPDGARASARCCGSSTSTASRSTASCRTSPPGGCGDVRGGRLALRDRQVRAGALARPARRCGRASTRCRTRSTSACCGPTRASCASGCRATALARDRRPRGRRAAARVPRPRRPRPRRADRRLPRRPTRCATGRASSSPTRSRAGGCRPRATRRTTPRCSPRAVEQLADGAGTDPEDRGRLRRRARRGRAVRGRGARLARPPRPPRAPPQVPADLGREHTGTASTQQAFGASSGPRARGARGGRARGHGLAHVGTSTNLGGWINRAGIWSPATASTGSPTTPTRSCAGARPPRPSHRARDRRGQPRRPARELGATWSRDGQPLLPVGTIYDPFVARALEPWSFGIYAGGQSILVGTPSGVTLAPRAARTSRSSRRRSASSSRAALLGAGLRAGPGVGVAARASRLGRPDGEAAYFRLSTDHSISRSPASRSDDAKEVLSGGYRLRPADDPRVVIAVDGRLGPRGG